MLIDWFTIVAQVLNFLILVWLLKRFLYKPILRAIDEREKRIAAELASADKKKVDAQKKSDEFTHKNEEFDQQRAALLRKATEEAQAERQRLLDEARQAAVTLSSKRQETLRNEEHNLHQAISHRTQQEVFAIGEEKELLALALKASPGPVIVRTTFDLPSAQRASTESAIKEALGAEIQVQFLTAPDLISGIEITTNGQKVTWSIADYLASLEKGVDELLKEKDRPEAKAEPKPEEPNPETKSQ
jgi:F-type H+-transporting ATPase subunit b